MRRGACRSAEVPQVISIDVVERLDNKRAGRSFDWKAAAPFSKNSF
jgi:hypothetical protein